MQLNSFFLFRTDRSGTDRSGTDRRTRSAFKRTARRFSGASFGAATVFLASSCTAKAQAPVPAAPMIVGADVSVLTSTEQAGGTFSENGKKGDPLLVLKRNGFNYVRLRLFHTPDKKRELLNDLSYDVALAKRAQAVGLKVLLDFHYSDTWADPGKQFKPAAWEKMSFEQLRGAVFEYTRGAVEAFKNAGATPDMIQIGNEINTGMMWPDGKADKEDAGWQKLAQLLQAGREGARAALRNGSKTQFLHHVADPHHVVWHMDNLLKHDALPDILGVSYYPIWHGDLASFRRNMDAIAAKYARPIVIVEVAYPWTNAAFDKYPDVHHGQNAAGMPEYTKAGQSEFYRRFITELKATPGGRGAGFFVWEPAWLPNAKFGSPMDNMTLFDQNGEALPALGVIRDAVK